MVIPADTLLPGAGYLLRLEFGKVTAANATGYPGAVGYALYGNVTWASLITVGYAPVVASQPESQTGLAGENVNFAVSAKWHHAAQLSVAFRWQQYHRSDRDRVDGCRLAVD